MRAAMVNRALPPGYAVRYVPAADATILQALARSRGRQSAAPRARPWQRR